MVDIHVTALCHNINILGVKEFNMRMVMQEGNLSTDRDIVYTCSWLKNTS